MRYKNFILFLFIIFLNYTFAGTTGKITGRVTDSQTGEPLPFGNIIVVGTSFGAATDINGYYTILNVPPDVYKVKASILGFTSVTVTDVKVEIDRTTRIDFKLKPKSLELAGEIVVLAQKHIVKKDVAASQKSVNADEIDALPVTSVGEVIALQAGINADLSVRGGASNETLFMVDGIVMRDERTNKPMSNVPLSAVQQISVQTGGFSAEYSNVRSGLVNVVTREGDKIKYSGTINYKISPPTQKHFGISPYDPNSYWLRPYLDPKVAWAGTGVWDEYTQRQYPKFDGWEAFSEATLKDDNPANDLTPEAAQKLFKWQYRKQGDIDKPDYYIDGGFGGPIPYVSKFLGDLRFFASFKREKNMYLMKLSREAITEQSFMVKFTSDISKSMKLNVIGLYGETFATSASRVGGTAYMSSVENVANVANSASFTVPWRIYTDLYYSPTSRYDNMISAKLTHVLNTHSFYEVQLRKIGKKYFTAAPSLRDTTKKYKLFDNFYADEAPLGFWPDPVYSVDGGLSMGGAVSTSRDFSEINTYSVRGDYINQIDNHNQIKTGIELTLDDFNMKFGMENFFLPEGNNWTVIKRTPYRASAYFQDKIEFEGWISTIGFIADYSSPNGSWYDIPVYDREFFSQNYDETNDSKYLGGSAKAQFTLSPRIAISHPITENSKLYFNYGHYRQIATSQNLYRVQRDVRNQLGLIGNPTIPFSKTISYELGFDQALFNNYLLHLSAYYKDNSDQELYVRYISFDDKVNYSKLTNNSYQDIFGFEVDVSKLYGDWVTGNINFEYRVGTSGYFGSLIYYEDPAKQREYLNRNPVQNRPRPRPRVKSYVDFHTPRNFGPTFADNKIFGEWHFMFIANWIAGQWFTWNPNNVPGIEFNAQWRPSYNVDLKLSKIFNFGNIDLKFYADMNNLFNFQFFSGLSFRDIHDYNFYMQSLHMPESDVGNLGYNNIPGTDQPGDYRNDDVNFVPMEYIKSTADSFTPNSRAIYYEASTKRYLQYKNDKWVPADQSYVDRVIKDKAYIDMPNQTFFTFLNPRNIFFGITINYKL